MNQPTNQRFVLAGGPGAGKTTLLEALGGRGYRCLPDVARAIIRARLQAGLSARPEPAAFAKAIFAGDVENYRSAPANDPCFFDRGVVDALGMLRHCGAMLQPDIDLYLRRYPYHQTVFVLPPWEAIYETDDERDQTFAESVRVFESVTTWYGRCGYRLQEVRPGTPEERVAFIERHIGRSNTI